MAGQQHVCFEAHQAIERGAHHLGVVVEHVGEELGARPSLTIPLVTSVSPEHNAWRSANR